MDREQNFVKMTHELNSGLSSIWSKEETEVTVSQSTFVFFFPCLMSYQLYCTAIYLTFVSKWTQTFTEIYLF
jgi:hypothetical protein